MAPGDVFTIEVSLVDLFLTRVRADNFRARRDTRERSKYVDIPGWVDGVYGGELSACRNKVIICGLADKSATELRARRPG